MAWSEDYLKDPLMSSQSSKKSLALRITILKSKVSFVQEYLSSFNYKDSYIEAIKNCLIGDYELEHFLLEDGISIFDRIGIAATYQLKEFCERLPSYFERATTRASLEFIILREKEAQAVEITQAYADKTSDIQTAAVLGVMLLRLGLVRKSKVLESFYHSYQDFLNKYNLYPHRAKMDKDRYDLLTGTEKGFVAHKIFLACNNCGVKMGHEKLVSKVKCRSKSWNSLVKNKNRMLPFCPSCLKTNTHCCICLRPVEVFNPCQDIEEKLKLVRGRRQRGGRAKARVTSINK